jgi:hypothetical protein
MSEKQTTFFIINCAEKLESPNQCSMGDGATRENVDRHKNILRQDCAGLSQSHNTVNNNE